MITSVLFYYYYFFVNYPLNEEQRVFSESITACAHCRHTTLKRLAHLTSGFQVSQSEIAGRGTETGKTPTPLKKTHLHGLSHKDLLCQHWVYTTTQTDHAFPISDFLLRHVQSNVYILNIDTTCLKAYTTFIVNHFFKCVALKPQVHTYKMWTFPQLSDRESK